MLGRLPLFYHVSTFPIDYYTVFTTHTALQISLAEYMYPPWNQIIKTDIT
jgi:hypothetical protein